MGKDSSRITGSDAISFEERIAYDKLTFYYISLPVALIGQMFGVMLLSAFQITVVDLYSIVVWMSVASLMVLYRFYHYFEFRRQSEYAKLQDARLWLHRYYTNVLVSGAVWGSSAVLMFPEGDILNQMVVVLFLFAMSFTSMGILASKKDLLLGYTLLAFVPLILRFFFLEGDVYTAVAYVVVVLMLVMVLISNYFGKVVNDSIGNHQHFLEIKHSHDKLKERFFSLFERAPVGIYYYDPELQIQDVNERFKEMNGVVYKEDLLGQDLHILKNATLIDAHKEVFGDKTGNYRGPYTSIFSKDLLYVDLSTVPMRDGDGHVTGGITIIKDITEEVNAKEEMIRNAYYDMLTHIPNRTLLMDKLNALIEKKNREPGHSALLFIDIDYFRRVNDTFGHNVGDIVLKQVAYLIEESIGAKDTIARLGGDKFAVLIPDLSTDRETASSRAMQTALQIKRSFGKPLKAAGQDYHASLSTGIVLFRESDVTAFDILKRAESAMYQAKKSGRNSISLYRHSMGVYAKEQLRIETDLHKALENSELQIHYQPQLEVESGKVIGAEALTRWFHPEKGPIPPDKFITVAEESGMIIALESWIFEQVFKEMQEWSTREGRLPVKHIAVNVSAIHFLQPGFVEQFKILMERYKIPGEWIELELTESELMHNVHDAIKKIGELKEVGITFSIDDFGTGYSSLAYLKQLPVDVLKIDQAFVLNMANNESDRMIVGSIISIAKKFGLTVLAEGVEGIEALEYLRESGCDIYQGYYAHKPMPLSVFEQVVKSSSL